GLSPTRIKSMAQIMCLEFPWALNMKHSLCLVETIPVSVCNELEGFCLPYPSSIIASVPPSG
uniref:Uncharacterized protein n=1 Tax=Colobus angolensis palliatus TaxID=336983 RepID=A0A2K5KD10_COLAP